MPSAVYFYLRQNGRAPVQDYVHSIADHRHVAAIQKTIERLALYNGRLPYPIVKHVEGKIWELRTRFGGRIFFCFDGPDIILLDGYTKKQDRIERSILERTRNIHRDYLRTSYRLPY